MSIVGQTFSDWELIVVDDGSTDGSLKGLIERNRDDRVRMIEHGENRGGAAALTTAFKQSSGSLVAIIDADDRALPTRLETQIQVMRADSAIGIVSCEARFIDAKGDFMGRKDSLYRREDIAGDSNFFFYMLHPGMLIRREVLIEFGYREEFTFAWDFDLLTRVVERHAVVVLPIELMEYRIHDESIGVSAQVAQETYNCAVRIITARRRAGLEERLVETTDAAASMIANGVPIGRIYRRFAKLALDEGFVICAALHARLALGRELCPSAIWMFVVSLIRGYWENPKQLRRLMREWRDIPVTALMESIGFPRRPHF